MSNENPPKAQFSQEIAVFDAGSTSQAVVYTAYTPETNRRRVVFSHSVQPLSFYWSMTPQQAIDLAAHLVELADSLRECDEVAA